MAYAGIEVEIKVQTSPAVALRIKEQLLKESPTQIHHVDTYYDNPSKSFLKMSPIREWLSVRNRGNKVIINHKLFHFNGQGKSTHSDESELTVQDLDDANRLLGALGFQPLITVNKHRTEAEIDSYLVSVDEVEELGYFVEVEATKDVGSVESTYEALKKFAIGLGLDPGDILEKGYPHLLLELHLGHELAR
jgi:adenylate cyclase class 2